MKITIIRGLPGSGKTTLAESLGALCYSADDWMVDDDGRYQYDARKLSYAHGSCRSAAWRSLFRGESFAVANTFSQRWEMAPYLDLAIQFGADVEVIDLFDAGLTDDELAARNVHGVPAEKIAAMRARWER